MKDSTQNGVNLVARVLLAHIFLLAGINKITGYAGTQSYMESMGVPGALLPIVILLEVGGATALIAGFQTRLVAGALALFCVSTAVLFHTNFADQTQMIMFMKNLTMAGGLLMVVGYGAGALSVDAKLGERRGQGTSSQLKQA